MNAYRHYRAQDWPRYGATAMALDCTAAWALRRRYPVPRSH